MNAIKYSLTSLLIAATTASLRADFDGDYTVGSPASYNLASGVPTDIGAWDALFSSGMGSSYVDTNAGPGSVTLSVTGQGGMGSTPGYNASLAFSYTFTSSGTVSFSYAIGASGGSFSATLDSEMQAAIGANYSFNVISGQTLAINLSATGTPGSTMTMPDGMGGFMSFPMMGYPNTETVTLSNFIGPSAIPEPASFAMAGGLGVFAFTALRRRRA